MPSDDLRTAIARIAVHGAQFCEDEEDSGDCDPMTLLPDEMRADHLVIREVQKVREETAARRRS
jgi:hypothetical protein